MCSICIVGHDGRKDLHPNIEYSRKVFVGGLPEGVDASMFQKVYNLFGKRFFRLAGCIRGFFSAFGSVIVDWPNRDKSTQVPKGI